MYALILNRQDKTWPPIFLSYCWHNSADAVANGSHKMPDALGATDPRVVKRELEERGLPCWLDIEQVGKVGGAMSWWRHQMETFSSLLALCAENSPATGEFPTQTPVARSFHVFFDLRLNKRLSKQ